MKKIIGLFLITSAIAMSSNLVPRFVEVGRRVLDKNRILKIEKNVATGCTIFYNLDDKTVEQLNVISTTDCDNLKMFLIMKE